MVNCLIYTIGEGSLAEGDVNLLQGYPFGLMSERRYAQNNSRKIDFLEKFAHRSRLPCTAHTFNRLAGHGYLPLMCS